MKKVSVKIKQMNNPPQPTTKPKVCPSSSSAQADQSLLNRLGKDELNRMHGRLTDSDSGQPKHREMN